jgi:hypothetical protein
MKMYSWTIYPQSYNYLTLIQDVKNKKYVEREWIPKLRKWLNDCGMRTCLRNLVKIMIDVIEIEPHNATCISCLVEFFAGCKYAADDVRVGKMENLKQKYSCRSTKYAIEYLKTFCKKTLLSNEWKNKNTWFQLRVRGMDSYSLCQIMSTRKKIIIYYAGMAHTKNVANYLRRKHLTKKTTLQNNLCIKFCELCMQSGILHCETVKFKDSILIFAGEDHTRTKIEFAPQIINFLKQECKNKTPLLFLIEKHIFNNVDTVQQNLTCNQPNLAIHKSRCDPFIDQTDCTDLEIVSIDNRHTDMGFLRTEIMDLFDSNEEFKRAVQEYNYSCLTSMCALCDTLLSCHYIKSYDETQ